MAIVGPIAPYNNVPIHVDYYSPQRFEISAISLGQTTTVTTTADTDYVVAQIVRLIIPPSFGSRQLNEQIGYVLSLPSSTQVEIAIDSSQDVDAFVLSSATTRPQILAVGDINSGVQNTSGRSSTGTYIPGSFIDISPS